MKKRLQKSMLPPALRAALKAVSHNCKGRGCGFEDGFIPFAKTKAERLTAGDPRLSLEERYRDHAGYVSVVKAAVDGLLRQRFLLPEDAERLIRQAEESNVLR